MYILCIHKLSERSTIDVDHAVSSIKLVTVVEKQSESSDAVKLIGIDDMRVFSTSPSRVLKKCFLHRIGKDWYENVVENLVCNEIFGARFTSHFSAVEQVAEDVGSSFLLIGSTFVEYTTPASSSEVELEIGRKSFGLQRLKSITSDLIKLASDQDTGLTNIQSKDEYEAL